MKLTDLFDRARGGVVQVLHIRDNSAVGFGSGFFLNNKLVTNYHVAAAALLPANGGDKIGIRFHGDAVDRASVALPCSEFAKRIRGASEEHGYDYLVADIPEALAHILHQFEFSDDAGPVMGQLVAFQGYPFGQPNLASHVGYVSSVYQSGVATMVQLDANVNSGNSGGPLLEIETGKVLGIISRKQTGLSEIFDQLIGSFDANAKVLGALRGGMSMGNVDVFQSMAVTQLQLGGLAQEIKRSANVGIGFAVKATALRDEESLKGNN